VRILLVAATALEIEPVVATFGPLAGEGERTRSFSFAGHAVDVLITGVGMVATAAWCSRVLSTSRYDLAINAGVCGSFVPRLQPGTVVHVTRDRLVELGAEDGEIFLTVHDLGLLGSHEHPFVDGMLINPRPPALPVLSMIPAATGVTVNTVHGDTRSIAQLTERFSPDVETMEGAAFMYACLIHAVPFAQLRGVSNIVERRNRAAWKLPEAIGALKVSTLSVFEQL